MRYFHKIFTGVDELVILYIVYEIADSKNFALYNLSLNFVKMILNATEVIPENFVAVR